MRSVLQILVAAALLASVCSAQERARGRQSSVSPLVAESIDLGRAPPTEQRHVVVGLALRNREELEAFLTDVQDPGSPAYGQFLSQEQFNALYAPTEAEEAAVVSHLERNGLVVTDRVPNRLLVGARGNVAALERAFGAEIHNVLFRGARHFAAFAEPSVPADIARSVIGIIGLDDLSERRPHLRSEGPVSGPNAALGANCCHLSPNDLATLYDNGSAFPGTGQTIVIAGAYAWQDSDNTAFNTQWGLPQLPAGSGQVCTGLLTPSGCKFSSQNSIEIALDVEYSHGTAPGAVIRNYMAASTANADFTTMYNRIVTDNPGHVVTTSWGACEAGLTAATQQTDDQIFANGNAIGQSWFAASGDNGSLDCSGILTVDNPANSPHVMGVGGTTPTCSGGMISGNPACAGYGSETAWSGSGGGISQVFARPTFQAGCGVPAGSQRLVPDVALEADTSPGDYVLEGGSWFIVGGTSGAAPQWAGFVTELNQKLAGGGLGNPGARLYGLCGTPAYHDITSGSNGTYAAGPGYDLVTGLGTIEARNFLAASGPTSTTTTSSTTTISTTTTTTTTTTTATTSTTTTTTRTTTTTTATTATTSTTTTSTTTATTTTATTATTSTTTSTLPGGTCGSPVVIPAEGGTFTGTTSGTSALSGCVSQTGSAPERIFQWTPAASGTATIQTCGAATTFDTVLYVRSGTCTGSQVACNDDTSGCATGDPCSPNNQHHGSLVTPTVTAGQTYVIVVDGYSGSCGGSSGQFILTVTPPVASTTSTTTTATSTSSTTIAASTTTAPPPTTTTATTSTTTSTLPGGTCSSPIVIPAAGGTFTGATSGTSGLSGCVSQTGSAPEQIFQWTPATSGTATIKTCGAATTFDTVLYVRSGTCTGSQVACNDDTTGCATGDPCSPNNQHHGSLVTPTVTAGQTYVIVVDGYSGSCGGSSGQFVLTVISP